MRNPRLVAPTIARNSAPLPGRGTPCSAFGYRRSRCTEPSMWWCRSTPAASLPVKGLLVLGHVSRLFALHVSSKHVGSHKSLDIRPDDPLGPFGHGLGTIILDVQTVLLLRLHLGGRELPTPAMVTVPDWVWLP
jgi:hypothetical protein